MSTMNTLFSDSFIADGAIPVFRVVVAGQDNDVNGKHCKLPGGQDANAILGVTMTASSASGDTIQVARAGLAKVQVATGAVTYGVPLRVFDIRGMVSEQTAAWVSGDGVVGYAEQASAASGDVITCWLGIRTLLA